MGKEGVPPMQSGQIGVEATENIVDLQDQKPVEILRQILDSENQDEVHMVAAMVGMQVGENTSLNSQVQPDIDRLALKLQQKVGMRYGADFHDLLEDQHGIRAALEQLEYGPDSLEIQGFSFENKKNEDTSEHLSFVSNQ